MNKKTFFKRNIIENLTVYWITHALIDLICAWVIFSIWKFEIVSIDRLFFLIILYNVLAFWLQVIFWILIDYFRNPRAMTILGCLLTGLSSIIFLSFPTVAIIFAWLWNALFHVGWWSISLNLTPHKASAPWVFVAPWAMWLFIWTVLGKGGQFVVWPFIVALFVLVILMLIIKTPEIDYDKKEKEHIKLNYLEIIMLFVLFSVAIRSFIGLSISFPWKTDFNLLIILITAIVLWKWIWWFLADKFGWIRISVWALVLSIPFLLLGFNNAFLWIIWMFLFNITMPITLLAISNILPWRPAFAFWLTVFALLLGWLPVLYWIKVTSFPMIFIIIMISALVLYYWLKLLLKNKYFRYNIKE